MGRRVFPALTVVRGRPDLSAARATRGATLKNLLRRRPIPAAPIDSLPVVVGEAREVEAGQVVSAGAVHTEDVEVMVKIAHAVRVERATVDEVVQAVGVVKGAQAAWADRVVMVVRGTI